MNMRKNVTELVVGLVLIVISFIVLEPTFLEYTRKPYSSDYSSLNTFIQDNRQYGDYILFQPGWLKGFARDLGMLQYIPDYSEDTFIRGLVERMWVVSLNEQEPKTRLTIRLVNTTEIGRLNVRLYEVTKKADNI